MSPTRIRPRPRRRPRSGRRATAADIPAVPAAAFKEVVLSTVGADAASSGSRRVGRRRPSAGAHYLGDAGLYAARVAGRVRPRAARRRRAAALPAARPRRAPPPAFVAGFHDGLALAALRGDGRDGRFVDGDAFDADGFERALDAAVADGRPSASRRPRLHSSPASERSTRAAGASCCRAGSRLMETGGFKGRTRVVERGDLYAAAADRFGLPVASIVAEYGMTELSSQYYDSLASRSRAQRVKAGPPWLRPIVVDPRRAPGRGRCRRRDPPYRLREPLIGASLSRPRISVH